NASDWNLQTINCTFISVEYNDPYSLRLNDSHPVIVFRGPRRVKEKETVFLHFVTHSHSQDFYTMSFLLMHNFSEFSALPDQLRLDRIARAHAQESLHAASAGLRLWGKISMTQLHLEDGEGPARTILDMESSLAASYFIENTPEAPSKSDNATDGRRRRRRRRMKRTQAGPMRPTADTRLKKQFFLFFEWKSGILAESHVVRTQSVWSVGASLCGVLLTLHKGYSLAAGNVRRLKRTRDRRQRSQQHRQ
uniref:Proton-activated chloride channel n=1 Tax=Macrostomum lignano TaxID=282301 RepID=A0A1I8GFN0_9PLAT